MSSYKFRFTDLYYLSGADDVFKSLGIDPRKECVQKNIEEMKESFLSDVKKSVVQMFNSVSTDLIKGVVNTLSNTILASGTVLAENLSRMILGSIVGTVLGIFTISLALFPIIEIYLHYLAVKNLYKLLDKRIFLMDSLKVEINILIDILESLKNVLIVDKRPFETFDFSEIIKNLKEAELLLSLEISRVNENNLLDDKINSNKVIQTSNIKSVIFYIDNAINLLTDGVYFEFVNRLKEVTDQYDIKTEIPDKFEFKEWSIYFTKVWSELKSKNSSPQVKKYVINKILSYFPVLVKILLFQNIFYSSSKIINKFTPIYLKVGLDKILDYEIKLEGGKTKKLKSYVDVSKYYKELFDFLGLPYTDSDEREKRIKDFIGNDTLDILNSTIKYYETIITIFPNLYKFIKQSGFFYIRFLLNSKEYIKITREDIESHSNKELGTFDFVLKKSEWVSYLNLAKGYLEPLISESIKLRAAKHLEGVTPLDFADFVYDVGTKIEDLKNFIKVKYFNPETKQTFTEPAELFIKEAQSLFSATYHEVSIFHNLSRIDELISQLQSLKFLLDKQIEIDNMEMSLASQVISAAESHPALSVFERYLSDILDEMKIKETLPDIKKAIENGDIGTLVYAVNAADSTSNLISLFKKCPGMEESSFNSVMSLISKSSLPSTDLPDFNKLMDIQKNVIDKSLQDLKQKESLINNIIDLFSKNSILGEKISMYDVVTEEITKQIMNQYV